MKQIEACMVPEDILKEMSTDGLVKTLLNYPLLGDIITVLILYTSFIRRPSNILY